MNDGVTATATTTTTTSLKDKIKHLALGAFMAKKSAASAAMTSSSPTPSSASPSVASSSCPSPLVLSECSSPSISSPPPGIMATANGSIMFPCSPIERTGGALGPSTASSSSLFFRQDDHLMMSSHDDGGQTHSFYDTPAATRGSQDGLHSVLTNEHRDPMLSAATAEELVGSAIASSSSNQLQSSMTTTSVFQKAASKANTASFVVNVGQQHHLQQQQPLLQCEPSRKDTFNLLGCFSTTLGGSSSNVDSHYVVCVFDKGCLFTAGVDTSQEMLSHLQSARGTKFDVIYSKIDQTRITFDQVSILVGQTWMPVEKPGTSQTVIENVSVGRQFFMQTTATHRVELYFLKMYGRVWISSSVLVTNVNSPLANLNDDFVLMAKKKTQLSNGNGNTQSAGRLQLVQQQQSQTLNIGAQQQQQRHHHSNVLVNLPTHPLPPSQTLHLSSGTITLHASSAAASSANQIAFPPSSPPFQPVPAISTSVSAPIATTTPLAVIEQSTRAVFQIINNQYQSLTAEQVFHCTFCTNCKKRFKYVMDHLFHFTMSAPCRGFITSSNSSGQKSFYAAFADILATRCKMVGHSDGGTSLICDVCNAEMNGPVQYGLHRDQHRPAHGDLYLCQFCSGLFRTPYGFIRHDCIKLWNVVNTIQHFSQMPTDPVTGPNEDAFKIYVRLSEDEKLHLLKCPVCAKQHAYMSGLVSHFRSSQQCFAGILQSAAGTDLNEVVDLASLIFAKVPLTPRPISCEICGIESQNQLGYAIHRDHHSLKKQGMLICKGCNNEYRAPCEFYRHNCNVRPSSAVNGAKLFWCPFCDVSRHCDIARETAKMRAAKSHHPQQVPALLSAAASTSDATSSSSLSASTVAANATSNNGNQLLIVSVQSLAQPNSSSQGLGENGLSSVEVDRKSKVKLPARKNNVKTEPMPTPPPKETIIKSPFATSPSATFEDETTQPTEGDEDGHDDDGGDILPGNFDLDYQQRDSAFPKDQKGATKRKSPSSSTPANESARSAPKRPRQTARKGHGSSKLVKTKKQRSDDDDDDDNTLLTHPTRSPSCPQDSYVCTDCSPFRILRGPESLANHNHEKESHSNINPLWVYNKLRVNMVDLGRENGDGKADEYSSRVRAELERIRAVGGEGVKGSRSTGLGGIKRNLLEEREDENKNLS